MIEDGRKEESDWNYRASPDLEGQTAQSGNLSPNISIYSISNYRRGDSLNRHHGK